MLKTLQKPALTFIWTKNNFYGSDPKMVKRNKYGARKKEVIKFQSQALLMYYLLQIFFWYLYLSCNEGNQASLNNSIYRVLNQIAYNLPSFHRFFNHYLKIRLNGWMDGYYRSPLKSNLQLGGRLCNKNFSFIHLIIGGTILTEPSSKLHHFR